MKLTKKNLNYGNYYIHLKDNNQINFTIRYVVFNPKKLFVDSATAKDIIRKDIHMSKKKISEEYDAIYGCWIKVGRGKNTHVEFNRTSKVAANIIFIIPKKWMRKAWQVLQNMEVPYEKDIFHS